MNTNINDIIRKHRENTKIYNLKEIDEVSKKKGNEISSLRCPFNKLHEVETECIPIAHYYDESGELQVVFSTEPSHCMALGCTGAGKTTSLCIPKVQILSRLKNKPSFFVVDVKGELLETLSGHLDKEGYEIQVIDLNEPEYSLCWNPFSKIYDNYLKAHNLVDEVKEHNDDINNYPHLKKFSFTNKAKRWYEFDGAAFSKIETLNKAIIHKREKLITDTTEEIKDLAYMFITSTNKDDSHWDDSARDMFTGTILAMLERTVLKEPYALTKDQFNLRNIINLLLSCSEEEFKKFINSSDKKGEAYRYANKLVNMAADKTRSCYYGILSAQLSPFKSYAIQKVTLHNSVDLSKISEKPMAIFMKMDDMKEANYSIAQLIVLRLYQELSFKASKLPRQRLTRPVHFILDEFGNFPPFKNFSNMISVSRGRNIWYTMICQSYRQLDLKYTEGVTGLILENSNVKMFFGSNDYKTKKEFSETCGLTTRISERAYLDGVDDYLSFMPIEQYNVVTVSDLSKINPSEVYIISFQTPVLHSRMERYFLVKEMTPLAPVEYRVIDDIEISSSKYNYNVSAEQNIHNKKKDFRMTYSREKEDFPNIISKIEYEQMVNITYNLLIDSIDYNAFGLNLLQNHTRKIMPKFFYDGLEMIDKEINLFINYEKTNISVKELESYKDNFIKETIRECIKVKENDFLSNFVVFATNACEDLETVLTRTSKYLPEIIISCLNTIIKKLNVSTKEEILKYIQS